MPLGMLPDISFKETEISFADISSIASLYISTFFFAVCHFIEMRIRALLLKYTERDPAIHPLCTARLEHQTRPRIRLPQYKMRVTEDKDNAVQHPQLRQNPVYYLHKDPEQNNKTLQLLSKSATILFKCCDSSLLFAPDDIDSSCFSSTQTTRKLFQNSQNEFFDPGSYQIPLPTSNTNNQKKSTNNLASE